MTPSGLPGGPPSGPPARPRLPRPNTVCFEIPGPTSSRARYPEVAREIGKQDFADDVACFQPRGSEAFLLSFENQINALKLVEKGISIAGQHYDVSEVTGGTTVITVYDAPYELPHAAIHRALSHYGEVKSVEHQKVPADIGCFFNGDRKVVISMKKPVPNILNVEGFEITCWYRKVTKLCRRCGATSHLAAACSIPPGPTPKRCGNCGNRWHHTGDCSGCFTCRTEGHKPEACPLLVIKAEEHNPPSSPPSTVSTLTMEKETDSTDQECDHSQGDSSMDLSDSTICSSPPPLPRPIPSQTETHPATCPPIPTKKGRYQQQFDSPPRSFRIPRMPHPDISKEELMKHEKRWRKFLADPSQHEDAKEILEEHIEEWKKRHAKHRR